MKWILLSFLTAVFPLLAEMKVLVFAGSTRADSYNKKLAGEAAAIARKMGAKVTIIDLKEYPMPLFDEDLETKLGMPEHAKRLREAMIGSNAILIASPEYNGSISGVLKNALDWASRTENGEASRTAFKGKTFGLMSASLGQGGGARGLVHLRAVIEDIGGQVVESQVSVPRAYEAFNEKGALKISALAKALQEEVEQTLGIIQK